jgi:hypothetical protein
VLSDDDRSLLWRNARLSWKLDSSQKDTYDRYRAWEARCLAARLRGESLPGMFPRIYIFDQARRTGKDFLSCLIKTEDALKRPGSVFSYGTAFQRDVSEIIVSLFEKITEDCPLDIRPVYRDAWRGQTAGLFFPNKSVIRLIGCDRGSDSLRGRFSNGIVLSECGFIEHLREVIVSILMPQLQGDPKATILLNSTPPVVPGHVYDDLFVPDAHDRGAVVERTIEDNPRLSRAEKDEFILAAGGLENETCQREYFCKRIRSPSRVVVPEFEDRHVVASPVPRYARAFTALDPGIRDMCGILWAYWDFERAKLVIQRSWAERNTNTNALIRILRTNENELWNSQSQLVYWDKDRFKPNPSLRVSDVEARLVIDMQQLHGLKVIQARKDDRLAAIHALRNAFLQDRIEIHPDAREAIAHIKNATWNKQRTDFDRSDLYGHFDVLAAAIYLWRHVTFEHNPFPPPGIEKLNLYGSGKLHLTPAHLRHPNSLFEKLAAVLPSTWSRFR